MRSGREIPALRLEKLGPKKQVNLGLALHACHVLTDSSVKSLKSDCCLKMSHSDLTTLFYFQS